MRLTRIALITNLCAFSCLPFGCSSETASETSGGQPADQVVASGEGESNQETGDESMTDVTGDDGETDASNDESVDDASNGEHQSTESEWVSDDGLNAMKVGQKYQLTLSSNATTGFSWSLQSGMDETVLVLDSSSYSSTENTDGMTGGGGSEIFIFRAIGVGTTGVELRYEQPWQPEEFVDEYRFEVTVVE